MLPDRLAVEHQLARVRSGLPLEDPAALWVHDLVGSMVVERGGTERGSCVSVIANPASDLLELDSGARVPAVFRAPCLLWKSSCGERPMIRSV